MRFFHGIKLGGLQQKIFNLMIIIILLLVGVYVGISRVMQKELTAVVEKAGVEQQASITAVSEATMEATLEASLTKTTALQAYIANDLFGDVKSDVLTMQSFATELFAHADSFTAHPVSAPSRENEGTVCAQLIHEEGVDPAGSDLAGLAANMSEIMISMYKSSGKLSSLFVGTADGYMVLVNDRPSVFLAQDDSPLPLDIRHRPWYALAAETGDVVFTGVETDAYTDNPMLECAAPVYVDGELIAVVGADIYLTSISDYVATAASYGGFVCVVDGNGRVLFSSQTEGSFKPESAEDAVDLRQSGNAGLAEFITTALKENTGLKFINVDGIDYYLAGVPMPMLGWTVISAVSAAVAREPTDAMLSRYEEINAEALGSYRTAAGHRGRTLMLLTLGVIVLASAGALLLAKRVVQPLEHMTKRINTLSGEDAAFEMEDVYRTGDEIEILAESFADISAKTRNYIGQITEITAEKERIGTELALATRIQGDMLPNIYPAFPDRPEFDIFASMDPAREVGGDFYDFFLVDDDHLCMVMADVSGKGIPAALFMMASRIILAMNAKLGKSPAEVLASTNDTICRNNREEMFVTVWLGILEISTGKLTAANAGHEYPVLAGPDGRFELVKDKHGFVLGGMEGMKYKEYELQLSPGSKLFLYTDGVPEATNAENELYGAERMLAALNDNADAAPEALLKAVRQSVDGFVKDAEQFDDLTMLAMEYKGEKA